MCWYVSCTYNNNRESVYNPDFCRQASAQTWQTAWTQTAMLYLSHWMPPPANSVNVQAAIHAERRVFLLLMLGLSLWNSHGNFNSDRRSCQQKRTIAHSLVIPSRSVSSRSSSSGNSCTDECLLEDTLKSFVHEGSSLGWISFCKFCCRHGTM